MFSWEDSSNAANLFAAGTPVSVGDDLSAGL